MPIGFAGYTDTYNKLKVFATEIEGDETPFANCVVRRALRCIRKLKERYIDAEEQEIRNKAIDEFKAEAMKQLTDLELKDRWTTVSGCKIILRDLAEQMKGE